MHKTETVSNHKNVDKSSTHLLKLAKTPTKRKEASLNGHSGGYLGWR